MCIDVRSCSTAVPAHKIEPSVSIIVKPMKGSMKEVSAPLAPHGDLAVMPWRPQLAKLYFCESREYPPTQRHLRPCTSKVRVDEATASEYAYPKSSTAMKREYFTLADADLPQMLKISCVTSQCEVLKNSRYPRESAETS